MRKRELRIDNCLGLQPKTLHHNLGFATLGYKKKNHIRKRRKKGWEIGLSRKKKREKID